MTRPATASSRVIGKRMMCSNVRGAGRLVENYFRLPRLIPRIRRRIRIHADRGTSWYRSAKNKRYRKIMFATRRIIIAMPPPFTGLASRTRVSILDCRLSSFSKVMRNRSLELCGAMTSRGNKFSKFDFMRAFHSIRILVISLSFRLVEPE